MGVEGGSNRRSEAPKVRPTERITCFNFRVSCDTFGLNPPKNFKMLGPGAHPQNDNGMQAHTAKPGP